MVSSVLALYTAGAQLAAGAAGSGRRHLPKYFSFYGYAPEAQHSWSNLGTAPDLPQAIDAWNRYRQPAMLSLKGWERRPDWPPICHYNATAGCPVGGLTKGWDRAMGAKIDEAMPWILNGTIRGLFLVSLATYSRSILRL
jgi:hypothetical protein